ncbi:MAG: hypothetical protein WBP11_03030 [Dokdonella sp.]
MVGMDVLNQSPGAQLAVVCDDLDAAVRFYTEQLGFRLDMIMPADAPRIAVISGFGIFVRLQQHSALSDAQAQQAATTLRLPRRLLPDSAAFDGKSAAPGNVLIEPVDEPCLGTAMPVIEAPTIKRADGNNEWSAGRAGMQYRDLIPDRIGGCVIASQIRIEQGGPVDDYVHYHKVGLQLIYCRRGWVRVVYEDQGPPFVMQPGDCVLQPPTIRHRVLESSAGLEVIELGIPAEHETWRDHELSLPTATVNPQRDFGGQRFVRHVASDAGWQDDVEGVVAIRDIGIDAATHQLASARVIQFRGTSDAQAVVAMPQTAFRFTFVLDGGVQLVPSRGNPVTLATDDACILPTNGACSLQANAGAQLLDICVRAT